MATFAHHIQAHGYAVLPALLSASQVQEVQNWLQHIVDYGAYVPASLEPEYESPTVAGEVHLRKIRRLFWHDPAFWYDLIRRTSIAPILYDIVGPHATLILHAAFIKPAYVGSAVAPHQDQALWGFPYPGAVSLWIAIDPATPENGCLELFEGSHALGLLPHGDMGPTAWHDSVDVSGAKLEARPVPLRSGDAVVWHRYMLHASAANRSPENRRGVVMVFADASHRPFDAHDRFPLSLIDSVRGAGEAYAAVSEAIGDARP